MSSGVEDEVGIRRVLAEYCHRIDDGDLTGVADLFAPDGCFAFRDDEACGAEALVEWFARSYPPHRRGRHLVSNEVIDVHGDAATAVSDYQVVRHRKGSLMIEVVGRYRDDLVRIDGRWRIRRRCADTLEG